MKKKSKKIVSFKLVDKPFGWIYEYKESLWEKILSWIGFYKVKYFLREFWWWIERQDQKIRLGFAEREGFDFYSYHAKYCIPRLKYMRDHIHGCPGDFVKNDDVDKGCEEWKKVLDKIIWSFEHCCDQPDLVYPKDYDERKIQRKYEDGSVSYEDIDQRKPSFEEYDKHYKRVQEGLDLFAKYYLNLWD